MSEMTHRASTRINDDMDKLLKKVAEDNRLSRSDVIRLSLEGNLQKVIANRYKGLPEDDRVIALKGISETMGKMSIIEQDNLKALSYLDQITIAINSGLSAISLKDVDVYKKSIVLSNDSLKDLLEVLNKIWLILA